MIPFEALKFQLQFHFVLFCIVNDKKYGLSLIMTLAYYAKKTSPRTKH
jgi:hypothetical protein